MTHTSTKQPVALRLADKYEVHGFLGEQRYAKDYWCSQAAAELRRQHARIVELEEMLRREVQHSAGLEAARIAYASEFKPDANGDPDVGKIHANIRAMKAQLASTQAAADAGNPVSTSATVSDEQIKAVFLANGFTIKEGMTDLKPYVYQAARALLATVGGQAQDGAMARNKKE